MEDCHTSHNVLCFMGGSFQRKKGKRDGIAAVLFIQNGIRLLDAKGNLIQTAAGDNGEPVDAEDTGEKGYNYASERFANRLAKAPRTWKVFSSKVHGDPATPVWKAYPGDRVVFRVMMPAENRMQRQKDGAFA